MSRLPHPEPEFVITEANRPDSRLLAEALVRVVLRPRVETAAPEEPEAAPTRKEAA